MTTWKTPTEAYAWLTAHSCETAAYASTLALLEWDQRTFIPTKAHPYRTEQRGAMTRLIHERETDPRRSEALALLDAATLEPDERANVREWRRDFDRLCRIPERLAVELARASSEAETAWERARPAGDWAAFQPHLERLLALKREEAEATGYEVEPYDALLDTFEPGERAASLQPLFASLAPILSALLDQVRGASRQPDTSLLDRNYEPERQRAFATQAVETLGYDFQAGRLDVSAHPFSTTLGPADSRLTTRFHPRNFSIALFGTLHEAGHGLYEQGLLARHWGTPLGQAVSLGVHESQSRLWENMVGRSPGFWRFFRTRFESAFPDLAPTSADALYAAVNTVRPGLIRVDADELSYNLHVLVRFELELALFRDQLRVDELPQAWNERMQRYLGLTPPGHADGVLQDVHWSAGLFGYFPTYTLGNIYAAQLYAAAQRDLGDLDDQFGQGEFHPLLHWLRRTVHTQGRRLPPKKLIATATGEERSIEPLVRYLEEKFGRLYGLR